jgi:hypothetical protein
MNLARKSSEISLQRARPDAQLGHWKTQYIFVSLLREKFAAVLIEDHPELLFYNLGLKN